MSAVHCSNYCPPYQEEDTDTWLVRVNQAVIIRLKWGQTEYHGRLMSVDSYMNIQLANTEEYIDGKNTGTLGQVLIRCVKLKSLKI